MPGRRELRIVIDTNLWISFLISKTQKKLDDILFSQPLRIYFSAELLNELQESISKPKLSKHFGSEAIKEMILAFEDFIEIIIVKSDVNICRDPNDNFILALCKDSRADFLLTGDKDLLELKEFGKTRIKTLTEFIAAIK